MCILVLISVAPSVAPDYVIQLEIPAANAVIKPKFFSNIYTEGPEILVY